MRPFVTFTLVLLALVGLCYCTVEGASPTWGAPGLPSGTDDVSPGTTVPTIAGVFPAGSSAIGASTATPVPRATGSPSVRTTTVRTTATKRVTTAPTTAPTTRRTSESPSRAPTAERTVPPATWAPAATVAPTVVIDTNVTSSWPTGQAPVTAPMWTQPVGTTDGPATGTPDIDPGMTPYTGPTEFVTVEPTATWAAPAFGANATPTELPTPTPFFTTEAVGPPPIELPPGAYDEWIGPAVTETSVPLPLDGPADGLSSSLLPRWLGYLLFIFLGVSGVAGLALIGSYLGRRPPAMDGPPPAVPERARPPSQYPRGPRLLQPGLDEPTADVQILADRIQGMTPESMHVERLGSFLLALEDAVRAQDRSSRLSQLIVFSSLPSAPVPAQAAAWAGQHGFRIIAIDGSGMALVMPALSSGGRTLLGVLPVREMVEGAGLTPMPIIAAPRSRSEVAGTG